MEKSDLSDSVWTPFSAKIRLVFGTVFREGSLSDFGTSPGGFGPIFASIWPLFWESFGRTLAK